MLKYDSTVPLDMREYAVEESGGIRVHDICHASPWSGRVPACLVRPRTPGPHAGILFMHLGGSDRNAFPDEAISYARRSGRSAHRRTRSPPPGRALIEFTDSDRDVFIQVAVDLRRGVDLLSGQERVDPSRLGHVGSSYGATLGAMLTSVEKLICAYVIAAGSARLRLFLDRWGGDLPEERLAAFLERMRFVDPVTHIGQAAPEELLLQNGRKDEIVPDEQAVALHRAASDPKTVRWYDAGHLLDDEARRDRFDWLAPRLRLTADTGEDPSGAA